MEKLQVHMFGRVSLEVSGRRIDDLETRSQKPWLLLSYMLYHHSRAVTQEELLRICWGGEEIKGDPANALRVVLHRTRIMLDKLELLPGRELIQRSRDGFEWNDRMPLYIDAEEFEVLYRKGKAEKEQQVRQDCFERAVGLYSGKFLSRNAGEHWVQCMAEKFRGMYLEMVQELLDMLMDAGEIKQGEQLCRRALEVEPYCEELYRRLMFALMKQGRVQEASALYEGLRETLLAEFGRTPEQETEAVYFEVLRALNPPALPVDMERLDTDGTDHGAKVCDFSFYRMFYSSAEWLIVQCGLSIYNIMFTLTDKPGRMVVDRTRERLMDALIEQLGQGLRRGNAISRNGDGQIVGMIRADEYETACRICERQVEQFCRNHPNSPMNLSYGVWRVGGEKK